MIWVVVLRKVHEPELHLTNDPLLKDEVNGDVLKGLQFLLHVYDLYSRSVFKV